MGTGLPARGVGGPRDRIPLARSLHPATKGLLMRTNIDVAAFAIAVAILAVDQARALNRKD